jgi:hypothetical protein
MNMATKIGNTLLARSLFSLETTEFTESIFMRFVLVFPSEISEKEGSSDKRSRWIHDLSESIGKNTAFLSLSLRPLQPLRETVFGCFCT